VGGKQVVVDETRGILLTLDGQDVRRSRALLLLPLQPGQVQWLSGRAWAERVIETGEVRDGRWQALETQPAKGNENPTRVRVSADQAMRLLLVCEQSALPRWRKAVERALTHPASLP
jgi:hypothetical protein